MHAIHMCAHSGQNLESSDVSLLVFGNGDGGGGPLEKMLENVSASREALASATF